MANKNNEHIPTPEGRAEVETYAGYGTPQTDIAYKMGISKGTLFKHYRHELKIGKIKANALVAQSLFAQTQDVKNPTRVAATIFWLKTQAGWVSPAKKVELTGKDGGPIQHALQLDVSRLTDDELDLFETLLAKITVTPIAGAADQLRGGEDEEAEGES